MGALGYHKKIGESARVCCPSRLRLSKPRSRLSTGEGGGAGVSWSCNCSRRSSTRLCLVIMVQVKAGELATAEGLSYLEAKHLLLLSYCIHIVFYILLKAEGAPVRTHPVIGRLLQLRTYLVRPRLIVSRFSLNDVTKGPAAAPLQESAHLKCLQALRSRS